VDQFSLGVAQLTQRGFEVGVSSVDSLRLCTSALWLGSESFDQSEPALVTATMIAQHPPGHAIAPGKTCPIRDFVETTPDNAQSLSQDVINRIGGHPTMQVTLQRFEDFGDDILESLSARALCLHQWSMSRCQSILSETSQVLARFSNQTRRRDTRLDRIKAILLEGRYDVVETVRPDKGQHCRPRT
jgi:hypothetical protein